MAEVEVNDLFLFRVVSIYETLRGLDISKEAAIGVIEEMLFGEAWARDQTPDAADGRS